MTLLADIDAWYGSDINVSSQGDLNTVTGTTRGEQRVIRRLFTNPGGDIFEPDYGAGLPAYVGQIIDVPKLQALCISQVLLESVVAPSPTPTVVITQSLTDLGSFDVQVNYTDQPTNTPVVLSFTVS